MKIKKEDLLNCLRNSEPMDYTAICNLLGCNRREMRAAMEEVATDFGITDTIVNLQDGKGYFIPDLNTPEGRCDAYKYLMQEKARAKSTIKRVTKLEYQLRKYGISTETEDGTRYRKARQDKGYSLREVAEITGIDVPTLSKIENGRVSATEWQKMVLATSYDVIL